HQPDTGGGPGRARRELRGPRGARMRQVGVDGCRAGWIAVTRTGGRLVHSVHARITDVVAAFPRAERIFVDVPIGLPSATAPVRDCDRLAREVLGARRPRVLPFLRSAAARARRAPHAVALP